MTVFVLLGFETSPALANFNADISNGTCYSGPGEILNQRFIPCGNAEGGHLPCCESLDMCLSSLACYNGQYGTTYLAGCTDESYSDVLCPNKNAYADHAWAGLVNCPDDLSIWIACDDDSETVTSGAPCTCSTSSRTAAFTDAPTLTNIVSLPNTNGGSLTWITYYGNVTFNGNLLSTSFDSEYYSSLAGQNSVSSSVSTINGAAASSSVSPPLGESIPSSSLSQSIPESLTNIPSPSTSPPGASFTSPPSLISNRAQRIGIGVGTAAGALILVFLILAIIICIRRKKNKWNKGEKNQTGNIRFSDGNGRTLGPGHATPDFERELRSPAWSGHKSELSADETALSSPPPTYHHWETAGTFGGNPSRGEQRSLMMPRGISELAGDGIFEMPA